MDAGFQRNVHENRSLDDDKTVMISNKILMQKRRAAFGDITNSSAETGAAGKKPCVKDVPVINTKVAVSTVQGEVQCDDQSETKNIMGDKAADEGNDAQMEVDWIDVDKDNVNMPAFLSLYVNDIFDYYRKRELLFAISDYIPRHNDLTVSMRAILVDWLVEVQQNFELVHETLYLAVKLTDYYLDRQKTPVAKDRLQLVGSTALSIACKFEEQSPPVIDDFLYVCDDAYTRVELLGMEKRLLETIGFDIGIPLSYTFLRRYAQCGRVGTPTLTLARYILESSLMDYKFVCCLESKMAAACLLLAMNMNCEGQWDATLIHYTSYTVANLLPLATQLNAMVATPSKTLGTIKSKYSHRIFHEVAKIAILSKSELELLRVHGASGRTNNVGSS